MKELIVAIDLELNQPSVLRRSNRPPVLLTPWRGPHHNRTSEVRSPKLSLLYRV
jgi:hypothetical protein